MELREGISGIRQFLSPSTTYQRPVLAVFSAVLLVQIFALISPLLSQLIVDHAAGIAGYGESTYIVLGYGLVVMTAALAELVRGLWVNAILARLEADAHPRAYSAVFGGFTRNALQLNTSEVISRFQSLRTTHQVAGNILIEGVVDALYVVTILAALVIYDSVIALVALLSVAAYFVARMLMGKRLVKTTREIAQAEAAQVAYLRDEVEAHQSVRFFGAHGGRLSTWDALVVRRLEKEVVRARATAYLRCIQQLSIGTISVITIAVGAHRVGAGELTLGAMFALVGLTFAMSTRVTLLTERLSSLDVLGVHWRRFRELAHERTRPPSDFIRLRAPAIGEASGVLINRLRVDFEDHHVLNLNSVVFPIGKLAVIIGRSGEGKTTLVRAIAGLITATEMDMAYVASDFSSNSGRDLCLNELQWSNHCSACFQGDSLFDGVSIAQNIACYDKVLDLARVEDAARFACIDADIRHEFGGYQALVFRQRLSEGQVQRLMLARALYRRPRVLLLDEVTSALDERTERDIISAVKNSGATVIAVAHRKQWIDAADEVHELSAGQLRLVRKQEDLRGH